MFEATAHRFRFRPNRFSHALYFDCVLTAFPMWGFSRSLGRNGEVRAQSEKWRISCALAKFVTLTDDILSGRDQTSEFFISRPGDPDSRRMEISPSLFRSAVYVDLWRPTLSSPGSIVTHAYESGIQM